MHWSLLNAKNDVPKAKITHNYNQIWSLGALLWVMLFGENPFQNVVAAEECNLIFPKNEALVSEVTEIPPKNSIPESV